MCKHIGWHTQAPSSPQPSKQRRNNFIAHVRLSMLHEPTLLTLPLVTSCTCQHCRQAQLARASQVLTSAMRERRKGFFT